MIVELRVEPQYKDNPEYIKELICKSIAPDNRLPFFKLVRSSIDSRGRIPMYQLRFEVQFEQDFPVVMPLTEDLPDVEKNQEIHIVGAGPAGYFAALELIKQGLKPIVWERGKDVQERRRDLKAIQQENTVNPDSNYCFGEGGAGTYSDGKLYTRATKRGDIYHILKLLVEHGAKEDILIEAHPHIGSNKLPNIIANIRKTIESRGGQVNFNSKLEDIIIKSNKIDGIKINGTFIKTARIILATGHSARDVYSILHQNKVFLEAKPFALGVRVEHPQSLIDDIQYKSYPRGSLLPAANYSLTCQIGSNGVFSFCMCPGGLIIPAATSPGEIVVNGMSLSRRDSPFANSGVVVTVDPIKLAPFQKYGPMAGVFYQQSVEQGMFNQGAKTQQAPAQRLTDFVQNKLSNSLNDCSYIPGLVSRNLHEILPKDVANALKLGFIQFGKLMKGYYTEMANVVGVESRTSAPIKIPRDQITLQHVQIEGLYPCAEGAGYAGGIISAALDGHNVAQAISQQINAKLV